MFTRQKKENIRFSHILCTHRILIFHRFVAVAAVAAAVLLIFTRTHSTFITSNCNWFREPVYNGNARWLLRSKCDSERAANENAERKKSY